MVRDHAPHSVSLSRSFLYVRVAWLMHVCMCDMTHACMYVWHDSCMYVCVTWLMHVCMCGMTHACMYVWHDSCTYVDATWQCPDSFALQHTVCCTSMPPSYQVLYVTHAATWGAYQQHAPLLLCMYTWYDSCVLQHTVRAALMCTATHSACCSHVYCNTQCVLLSCVLQHTVRAARMPLK